MKNGLSNKAVVVIYALNRERRALLTTAASFPTHFQNATTTA